MKIANTNRFLFFTCLLILLLADNNLLAFNVENTNAEESVFYSLLFLKEVDQTKFNDDALASYKEQAIIASNNNDVIAASNYAEKYIKYSGNTGFIDSGYFNQFNDTVEFSILRNKYSLHFSLLDFLYLFSAIVGFFIAIILLLKKNQDKVAKLLVCGFVLINSLFLFHLFLSLTNLKYRVPHVLYMSAFSVYLYGPLIYFYFKRVSINYKFKKIDLLHLLPTVIIFILMFPIVLLSGSEKLNVMLDVGIINKEPYLNYIVTTKFISLIIYGFLVLKVYLKHKGKIEIFSTTVQKWLRMLVVFTEVYVLSYVIYGLTLIDVIPKSAILFNFQIIMMATMVLYIGYSSYLSPNLFSVKEKSKKVKYKKSGLTVRYSEELKDKLISLFEEEKIYRMNSVNLNYLSERLGTSRHNASQIVNEHFNLNFFELVNKYRINEALEILKNDTNKNLNIIDVAYEVGFNNKVTFNKSFKKILSLTPSQYIMTIRA